jgi:hypothetical protein
VLSVLERIYPGGVTEKLLDPWGRPYLYFFKVPPDPYSPGHYRALPKGHAWKGTYWTSPAQAQPALVVEEPVLNFSYRDDFPVKNAPNLRARWRGTLHLTRAGDYSFLLAASGHSRCELEVDGKKAGRENQEVALALSPGDHAVVIRYQREGGFEQAFHLAWKKPGEGRYGILTPDALR